MDGKRREFRLKRATGRVECGPPCGRIARYVISTFSVFSLLLSLATCMLWRRSYSLGEGFMKDAPDKMTIVSSERGCLDITTNQTDYTIGVRPKPRPVVDWHYVSQKSDPSAPDDHDGPELLRSWVLDHKDVRPRLEVGPRKVLTTSRATGSLIGLPPCYSRCQLGFTSREDSGEGAAARPPPAPPAATTSAPRPTAVRSAAERDAKYQIAKRKFEI